ncbi:SusD family protein [Mucilaginibacter mallensis]|uniref:SusD family protein n=1 Tax=Mucilaginibacter mallensis TaxID=652787 RepID=A0A1H2CE56_MUCMA|nr:RagB/SusD family nutrient uptake outer membrane protein [Mucilaginibacter mallensis]SDT68624.1 SusD family protein [Mucilaginibacter mallensis]
MKDFTYLKACICFLLFAGVFSGCKKEDSFLNVKPNESLAVPSTLSDLQGIIHNQAVLNGNYPSLGEIACDDYYVSTSLWDNQGTTARNAYVWAKTVYDAGSNVPDWSDSYNQVYYANIVLDYLPKVTYSPSQQQLYNQVKGSALFFRSIAFYNLVQTFALPYDPSTASSDLGIPLRLTSDINAKSVRATEKDCYQQILTDLQTALALLPNSATDITVPSKAATYGLLSRIDLALGDFSGSLANATSCLSLNNTLQDFNQLNPNAFPVFPNYSPEELFHSSLEGNGLVGFNAQVDSNVYKSFSDPNDLRLAIFFYNNGGQIEFNSQFDKHSNVTSAIGTNEIYLNKAECEARAGDIKNAMADLNALLVMRWVTGTFKPYTATTSTDALTQILSERRKELLLSGIRWTDLRRLNKDSRFAITLKRNINNTIYTLPPNDPRYAFPIPDNEIELTGEPQNNR